MDRNHMFHRPQSGFDDDAPTSTSAASAARTTACAFARNPSSKSQPTSTYKPKHYSSNVPRRAYSSPYPSLTQNPSPSPFTHPFSHKPLPIRQHRRPPDPHRRPHPHRPHPHRPHPHRPHPHRRPNPHPIILPRPKYSPRYSRAAPPMHSPTHNPESSFSPDNKLPPLLLNDNDRMLPAISTITGNTGTRSPSGGLGFHRPPPPSQLSGSMPFRQMRPIHNDSPASMDVDTTSAASTPSPDRQKEDTPTSITLDDPDVRLAAEALGDLRADFVSSPPDTSGPMSPPTQTIDSTVSSKPQSPRPARPEPLLSLLTTSNLTHPFVKSTVGSGLAAYGGAKNFSPRFKSGAEYVEGYLLPVAKTVNRTARRTGVEGGVRWFLGAGSRHAAPTSDADAEGSKKRRKVNGQNADQADNDAQDSPPTPKSARRSSVSTVDTLPAYDEQRSPAYTESAAGANNQDRAWQTRLFMTTSGLSIAMSSESMRSLKYCLKWLRWSNDHMGRTISSLKAALEDYEKACQPVTQEESEDVSEGGSGTKTPEEKRTEIAHRIQLIKGDILKTLQEVVTMVSKYAGGALPENARVLVRRHLTSLPQRFRLATMTDNHVNENGEVDKDSALREGAQKMLVLAKEGLDMVTQISGVLDGTIVSAEEWCERMGKKREPEKEELGPLPPAIEANGDVKMA